MCSCVLSVRRAICIHAAQLMLGGSICSTCALWVMQSECQCIHVCLMSVSMPPCTACPDNGRCCFVAECSDTVITEYTINWIVNVQYFKYFFPKKGFSSWNDATQFPKCHSRGTMHPVHPVHPVLSSLLGVFFFFIQSPSIFHPLSYSHNLSVCDTYNTQQPDPRVLHGPSTHIAQEDMGVR